MPPVSSDARTLQRKIRATAMVCVTLSIVTMPEVLTKALLQRYALGPAGIFGLEYAVRKKSDFIEADLHGVPL